MNNFKTITTTLFIVYLLHCYVFANDSSSGTGRTIGESHENNVNGGEHKYRIEGTVSVAYASDKDWMANIRIFVDGGGYIGFLKNDGSFSISVPSGSYVVEVVHSSYVFEPVRVDITSKGKIRARRLNNLQPSVVQTLSYPVKLKARQLANYFQTREQWRVTDFLFSPMVLMMFLPLVLLMILPKLINTQDPETQREMQQSMGFLNPKQGMPDLSEMMTKLFSGGSSSAAKKQTKSKAVKKRNTNM